MLCRVVKKVKHHATRLELSTIRFSQQHQCCTAKRYNDRCIRKGLPEDNSVRGGPDLFTVRLLTKTAALMAQIQKNNGAPAKKRRHGGDPTKVVFCLVLLRSVRADIGALHSSLMTFLSKSPPLVFRYIVTDEN